MCGLPSPGRRVGTSQAALEGLLTIGLGHCIKLESEL